MDDLMELLLDVLLEGSVETASSPRTPLGVRVVLILILGIGYIGVSGLIFWVGFDTGKWGLMLLGLTLLTAGAVWFWYKRREFLRRRKRTEKKL